MIAHYFDPPPFVIVRGQLPNVPLKPDPTAARQIAQELDIPTAQWLYLGEHQHRQLQTARSGGRARRRRTLGFSRDRQELAESGAEPILARPEEKSWACWRRRNKRNMGKALTPSPRSIDLCYN